MKTISDNEIVDTSRGHKRIGALFDENAILNATNKDLLLVQSDLLAALEWALLFLEGSRDTDATLNNKKFNARIAEAKAAISRAKGLP